MYAPPDTLTSWPVMWAARSDARKSVRLAMSSGRPMRRIGWLSTLNISPPSAAAFAISHERMQAVNFTSALDLHPYAFMYRRPKEVSRAILFIDPFTPLVWIGIAVMTAIIGPIFYVIHRSSLYYKYNNEYYNDDD